MNTTEVISIAVIAYLVGGLLGFYLCHKNYKVERNTIIQSQKNTIISLRKACSSKNIEPMLVDMSTCEVDYYKTKWYQCPKCGSHSVLEGKRSCIECKQILKWNNNNKY